MIITVNNNKYEINNKTNLYEWTKSINNEKKEQGMILSHIIINDDQEIYDNIESYLIEGTENLKSLELVYITNKEFINDILCSMESYLLKAIPEIEGLVSDLYSDFNQDTNVNLVHFVEGLQWINTIINSISHIDVYILNLNQYLNNNSMLSPHLNEMVEALEIEDYVLLADIINYEILPLLKELRSLVVETIDTEGVRKSVN